VTEVFHARAVLTDIEGTTGSIAFVKDVLFPYADSHLDDYVARNAGDRAVAEVLRDAALEARIDPNERDAVLAQLHEWIARDAKIAPLKTLEGLIWADGYRGGELRGHIYDDAAQALRAWHAQGLALYAYSSGSIAAQELIFAHSVAGDLRSLFSRFFDTTSGSKREPASYAGIARAIGLAPAEILFLSDSAAELDAAQGAGMQAVQLARPEDGTHPSPTHRSVTSFAQLLLADPAH
jgi:enolase-phosphatase E1